MKGRVDSARRPSADGSVQSLPQAVTLSQVTTLRRRVLDAARRSVEEFGPDSLRLRTVASTIGCGVASLYYHFSDKDQLLAALATEGFQDLEKQMRRGIMDRKHPVSTQCALNGYLEFMQRHLRLYALMHSEYILTNYVATQVAEHGALRVLQETLASDQIIPAEDIENVSLMLWALLRGSASIIRIRAEHDPDLALSYSDKITAGYEAVVRWSQVAP